MAVQFPDVFIQWVDDATTRQITPGTTSGTYTITNDGQASGTIVDNGDDTFTLNLTNLKTQAIKWVAFPWQSDEEPLGGSGLDDIHYIPRLGGIKHLNSLFTAYGWASLAYPGNVVSPFIIRADDTEARIVAAANWPPKYCTVQYSLNRDIVVYFDDYVSRAAGSSPAFTAKAFYKKISGTGTISQPMWMQILDYYKTWLYARLTESNIEPISYPEWIRQAHGFYDVQLENINSFSASTLEADFNKWKAYLPWLQMWGQMTNYGEGCCSRLDTIHARFTGLTTLASSLVSQGYRVGFYTKPPDIVKDTGNYIPLDGSTGHKIDDSDTPTSIQTIADNSVTVAQNCVTSTGGWDAGVAVDDIIRLTKSGYDQYVTVKRKGTAADGDANNLYIDSKLSFANGLNAQVDRYSGGTLNSLQYFTGWLGKSIGGSFGGNAAYADVLAVGAFGDPLTIANLCKNYTISPHIFTEGVSDIIPRTGSYSGSIAVGSINMGSVSNVANISIGSRIATLSSGNFGTQIREWDTMSIGSGLFIIDSTSPARTNLTYTFNTTTTAPPASGEVRFNNSAYGSATNIYIHETDVNSINQSAALSTSFARIRIYKQSNNSIYLDATVTGTIDSGTYRTLAITPVTTKNSFTDGDIVVVEISPNITSITMKAASTQTYTNQTYIAYRWTGYPGKTTNNITSTLDNSVSFIELVRYLLPQRMSILGEVNTDYWYWGNIRGAGYHVERQAFLLGMKFDAISPEDTYQGDIIDDAVRQSIELRNEHNWWDRDFEYKHQIGISNISNANVDVRRFTDSAGYDVFVVDNWDQTGAGTFDFNTTTYDFTNEQLQIIDTRPDLSVKVLIRTQVPRDALIDRRSTRLLLKISEQGIVYDAVQWQFFGPLVSTVLTPEFDVTTPITTTTPGITSPDIYELNIILAENRKYRLRVRFRNELGIYTGWTDFFEFKSKNYRDFTSFTRGNFSREKVVVTQGATLNYDP